MVRLLAGVLACDQRVDIVGHCLDCKRKGETDVNGRKKDKVVGENPQCNRIVGS